MADQTPFLDLVKPAGGEPVEILVINENMDKLDEWAEEQGDPSARIRAFKGPANDRDTIVPNPLEGDTYREVDGKRIRWERAGGVWVTSEGGLYLMRASAVGGTGMAVNDSGHIDLTAATGDITIDGIFSSRFDHFLVDLLVDTASGDVGASFGFRGSGTAFPGLNYTSSYVEHAVGIGPVRTDFSGTASAALGRIAVNGGVVQLDVIRPTKTTGRKLFQTRSTDAAGYSRVGGGFYNGVQAADGISITLGSVTVTGRIKVYGYR